MTIPDEPRLIDENQTWGDGSSENPHSAVPAESDDEMLTGEPDKPIQSDLVTAEIEAIHGNVTSALYGTDVLPEEAIHPSADANGQPISDDMAWGGDDGKSARHG